MFQFIGFAIRYLPLVVAAVQMVEGMVSRDTTGQAKKDLATKFIIDTLTGFGVTISPRTRDIIGQVIDLAVNILNFFGIFTHKADTPEGEDDGGIVDSMEAESRAVEARSENERALADLEAILRSN